MARFLPALRARPQHKTADVTHERGHPCIDGRRFPRTLWHLDPNGAGGKLLSGHGERKGPEPVPCRPMRHPVLRGPLCQLHGNRLPRPLQDGTDEVANPTHVPVPPSEADARKPGLLPAHSFRRIPSGPNLLSYIGTLGPLRSRRAPTEMLRTDRKFKTERHFTCASPPAIAIQSPIRANRTGEIRSGARGRWPFAPAPARAGTPPPH